MEEKLIRPRIKILIAFTEYRFQGIAGRNFNGQCYSTISELINHQQWLRITCWQNPGDKALRYYVFSLEIDNPKSKSGFDNLNWAASMLTGPGNNLSGISEVELVDKMKKTIYYLSKNSSGKNAELILKWEGDEG